jgi:hypothetical protein
MIAIADHFEPAIVPERPGAYATRDEQEERVEAWCAGYPSAIAAWRDSAGHPLRHTYFYPAEQYSKVLLDRLSEHCRAGWGEIEIHLHHGIDAPDTAANTRKVLCQFRDTLAAHGCLARWNGGGEPRYAFVHGNWALANSLGGRGCGVDAEMEILAETGCYADLTLPPAPHLPQIGKINALYECRVPLGRRAPHRRGRDLRRDRPPRVWPLIVQGPLGLTFTRRVRGWPVPSIETGGLTLGNPPSMARLRLWRSAAIRVKHRPDWLFIKLDCHGMNPADAPAIMGAPMQRFLSELTDGAGGGSRSRIHFVTAREMVNMILAACDGREGDPGAYRDYRLRLISA